MLLETHEETIADVREDQLAGVVERLTDPAKAFVVLSLGEDQENYLQAAGAFHDGFIVERRDGSAGEHYRADERLTAAELLLMLTGYLAGDPEWSHATTWHRIRVGFDVDPARA